MEIWDLYDENRVPTGRTHIRGERLPLGFYHLAVHVWIRNSRGEFLISQRSAWRRSYPLLWESVGGSVLAGEDSLGGALRETMEEVGIALDPERGSIVHQKTRKSTGEPHTGDHLDVWLFDFDGEPDLGGATTDEVVQCRWALPEEIGALMERGEMVPTREYFFAALAN